MRMYNKEGAEIIVDKEQVDIMFKSGWSKEKPSDEVSEEKEEKEEESSEEQEVATETTTEKTAPIPKKISAIKVGKK